MKKRIWILVVLVILLALTGVGMKMYRDYWNATYIVIDEQELLRDVTELDYRGQSVPAPEALAQLTELKLLDLRDTGLTAQKYDSYVQALPGCRILWSVPFRDRFFPQETTELTIDAPKTEDFGELAYFTELRTVYLENCTDVEVIRNLQETFPELEIHYQVVLGGMHYGEEATEITLENGNLEELERALPFLWDLERVTFTGETPENEQIYQLANRYPDIVFQWNFELFGIPVSSEDTQLILSGIPMESVEEVEASLKYFRNLERVEMCDCGISSEEMDALGKRHPEIRFIWTVHVGRAALRTDVTAFMPYQYGYAYDHALTDKDTKELKYCVDMICMDLGHMDLYDFSFLENMTKLQYLVLADTWGSDFSVLENLTELVFLELFVSKFSQTEVLTGMTKLEDLNLSYTNVNDIEPLKEMTWLKRLWMIRCDYLSAAEKEAVAAALPDTQVVFVGANSVAVGWRTGQRYYEMRDLLGMNYME